MKNFQATEIRSLVMKLTYLPIGWGTDPAIYSNASEFKGPKVKEEENHSETQISQNSQKSQKSRPKLEIFQKP